jgi:translation initiation factor eIF-2B subunit delta
MKSSKSPNVVEPVSGCSRLAFFDHLPRKQSVKNIDLVECDRVLHPATIKLGALYRSGIIQSDDDRVTTLIAAFSNIIKDYKTPPKKVLREDLDKSLSKQVCKFALPRSSSMPIFVLCLINVYLTLTGEQRFNI